MKFKIHKCEMYDIKSTEVLHSACNSVSRCVSITIPQALSMYVLSTNRKGYKVVKEKKGSEED